MKQKWHWLNGAGRLMYDVEPVAVAPHDPELCHKEPCDECAAVAVNKAKAPVCATCGMDGGDGELWDAPSQSFYPCPTCRTPDASAEPVRGATGRCETCGHHRAAHEGHTVSDQFGMVPPTHCSQGCGCRAFVATGKAAGAERCPFISRAYGGQCEKEAGHEGLCVSLGDGFHGGQR